MAFDWCGQTGDKVISHLRCRSNRECGNTNLAAISETKGIEVRDTDIGTIILHPGVSRRLARNLLINGAGVLLLGELVGHRAAEDDAAGLGRAAGLDIDEDAEIEATLNPRVWWEDDAAVVVVQA
jgi:hypothetical protein